MWRIAGDRAWWESARMQATVDLAFPARGLSVTRLGQSEVAELHLCQIEVPPRPTGQGQPLAERYVRDADLIVTYGETAGSPLRPQVYWRVVDDAGRSESILIEAIVSNQTELLDSDPRICIACTLPAACWLDASGDIQPPAFRRLSIATDSPTEIAVEPPGCAFLARLNDVPWSYGQFVRSADLLDVTLSWSEPRQTARLSAAFFHARLEKGVIRRVCSRGLLAPRDGDIDLAARYFQRALCAPPPLTV